MGTISILNRATQAQGRRAAVRRGGNEIGGVEDIPRAASPATVIYAGFGNRGDVLHTLALEAVAEICAHHCRAASSSLEVELREHFHRVRDGLRDRPELAGVLARGVRSTGAQRGIANPHARHLDAMVAAGMDRQTACLAFAAMTALAAAHSVPGGHHGCADCGSDENASPDDGLDVEEQFEVSLELMLRGIRATTRGR